MKLCLGIYIFVQIVEKTWNKSMIRNFKKKIKIVFYEGKMKKLHLTLLIVILLVTSCVPSGYSEPVESVDISAPTNNVYRYTDSETGVVCYLFTPRADTAAISCLPISQTNLK